MSVKLTFLGAADTVTGSRTLLEARGRRWLIDCGLFQGAKPIRMRNWQEFSPKPSTLDGVILTHAHLDHSGYLPKLCREGFRGRILATKGTTDLCGVLLRDAARLEEESAAYANKTGYSNHKPALPLFTEDDALEALSRFDAQPRHEWLRLGEGISLRFLRAGHIIGASLVQIGIEMEHGQKVVTFTGDLGNGRSHCLRGPDVLHETDALIIESTYGDRLQPRTSPLDELAAIVNRTISRSGVLIIPAFAVGRAQEVTYMLRLLEDRRQIPQVPVVLDSPMAKAAMDICLHHSEDQVFDSAFHHARDPFRPHQFEVAVTPDESAYACMREGPMIVISASGMLNGGRVLHHLKRRLPDSNNTVLFSGYQAEGTKGRFLQEDGSKVGSIRIHHVEVPVEAEIATIDHLSSHADQQDILDYMDRMRQIPEHIFINHGAPNAQAALAEKIRGRFAVEAMTVCDANTVVLW